MSNNRQINAVIEGFVSADSATKQEQGRRFAYVLGLTPGPAGADGGIDGYGVVDGSKIYFQSKLKSSRLGAEDAGIFYSNLVRHQADIGILLAGVGYTASTPSLPNAGFQNRLLEFPNIENYRIHLLSLRDILLRDTPQWDRAVDDLPPVRQLTREAWDGFNEI
ncbi:MAG: restriction endonuclease [Planktothrix sp.]